jgi:uncharacterized protein YjbI with pentapeptide repeats
MKYLTLLILACCLLCGCGPTTVNTLVKNQGAQQLTGKDLLTLVKGNTLFIHSFNEETPLYFDPSGQLFGKISSTEKDKGKWDVTEGGELCFRMDKWWYGDLRCFQVYSNTEKTKLHLATGSGVLQYSAQQQAGDSQQLYTGSDQQKINQRRSILNQSESEGGMSSAAGNARVDARHESTTPSIIEEQPRVRVDNSVKDNNATFEYMAKDCPGCDLAGIDLGKAELNRAKLAKANLRGDNLSMANLRQADLRGADLRESILTYANLPGANLQGADLRGAVLKGANLIRADLTGAKLEGADLTEILREGARGLK